MPHNVSRTQVRYTPLFGRDTWSQIQTPDLVSKSLNELVPINLFSGFEYRWADGVQIKKPIEVSAPKYVEYLMDWIEAQLDDESIFPQKLGTLTTHFEFDTI